MTPETNGMQEGAGKMNFNAKAILFMSIFVLVDCRAR